MYEIFIESINLGIWGAIMNGSYILKHVDDKQLDKTWN